MRSCQDFIDALYDFVAAELSLDEFDELMEHLRSCPVCQDELDRYEQVIELARGLPDKTPPRHLLTRFRSALPHLKQVPPWDG